MWNRDERKKFQQLMTALAENYGRVYSAFTVHMWLETLQHFPFELVKKAIQEHMATHRDNPKLADIINRIRGFAGFRDAEAVAEKAYREALDAAARIGAYCSVRFRDPVVNAVINELGGWCELCRLEEGTPEKAIYRQSFVRLYLYYLKNGRVPRVDYLPGIVEEHNSSAGYELPDILEIGEIRNRNTALYEAETTIRLDEGRKIRAALKPRSRKALPEAKPEVKPASPEEAAKYLEELKKITSRIGRSMPEAGHEAERVN